jgi:Kdo2-lipid IVA lauroyltransferase/acyltransferase
VVRISQLRSSDSREERPLIRLKDVAWLVYLYPARWLARVLPISWLHALGDVAALLGSTCLRGPRRRLRERLRLAFDQETPDSRLQDIARQYFRNAILRFLDDLLMDRLFRGRCLRNVEVVHLERLTSALAAGRGAILVSGHFLASRLGKRYLADIGYPSLSVRNFEPPEPWAGRLGMRFLTKRYVSFVGSVLGEEVSIQDPECSLKMAAALRSGGLIDLHADAPFGRERVPRELLGEVFDFPVGYLRVARFAGCPLVPIHCQGSSRRLRIEFEHALMVESAPDRDSFAELNLTGVLRILEKQIRTHPAEWDLWIRW